MGRFTEMRSFVAVADSGGFAAAAELMDISKAAISRHVADLEARLGVRLMHRTTRRVSLTDEGRIFVERCRDLLSHLDEAEAEITARRADPSGILRANVPLAFGIHHLASLWGEFHARHPKVHLDVTLSDRRVDLIEEGFDVAIRISNQPGETLIARRLATTRLVLCASPEYLLRHPELTHPNDLSTHVTASYVYSSEADVWNFEGPEGRVTVVTQPGFHTNNGDTCRAIALAGYAIILQPSFLVGEDLRSGKLVELLPQYRSTQLAIQVVYASRKHITPKVRALIDFLVEKFQSPEWPE